MADMFQFNSPVSAQISRARRSSYNRPPKNSSRRRSSRTNRLNSAAQAASRGDAGDHSDGSRALMYNSHLDHASTPFDRLPPSFFSPEGQQDGRSIPGNAFPSPSYLNTDTVAPEGDPGFAMLHPERTNHPVGGTGTPHITERPDESTVQIHDDHQRHPNNHTTSLSQGQHGLAVETTQSPQGTTPTMLHRSVAVAPVARTAWAGELLPGESLDAPPSRFRPNTPEAFPHELGLTGAARAQLTIDSTFNENAWPVDDLRRTYDYGDFITTWRERSRDDRIVTQPALQSRVPLEHDKVVSYSSIEPDLDMQGLQWSSAYPTREEALLARKSLHPCRETREHSGRLRDVEEAETTAKDRYAFRNFVPGHRAMFSHYQLRNVLAASGRHAIYYAAKGRVWRTSLACPTLATVVLDYSKTLERTEGFRITCLSASRSDPYCRRPADGLLLAGGFNGEFVLLNTNGFGGHSPIEGTVTHAYNGLVTHIHQFESRQSGLPQASFCSNEGKMRLMDIRTMSFTNTFSYNDIPINCSATSADRRLRALVGDMKDVFITDSEEGKVLVTLRIHQDHGFACAWSDDGRYVATAAQDDMVVIWDARKWASPVATQPTVMSCARSLHFTHSGALVVAENEDVVSIFESGSFSKKQDLRFFGSVAGVAVIDDGGEIVVANCDRNVGGLLSFESRNRRRGNLSPYCRDEGVDLGLIMP